MAVLFLAALAAVLVTVSGMDVPTMAFDEGFSPLFGEANMEQSPDGRTVRLTLDRRSGSGFISADYYHHGFFSANVRLPKDHTAGVVVAFYLSNGDVFEKNHDELDFEFLGNRRRHEWRLQTNVYGNGSTERGREERYLMPFDPTSSEHRFSILWSSRVVIFYVDGVAIREVPRSPEMGGDYPSKPMAVYATIWDGSAWATDGGRHRVDYAYAPFAADFSDLVLRGCGPAVVAAECEIALMTHERAVVTPAKRAAMRRFRRRYMIYTVCHDRVRYNGIVFPECDVDHDGSERERFHEWGEAKHIVPHRRVRADKAGKSAAVDVDGRPSTWPAGGALRAD